MLVASGTCSVVGLGHVVVLGYSHTGSVVGLGAWGRVRIMPGHYYYIVNIIDSYWHFSKYLARCGIVSTSFMVVFALE